LKQFSFLGIRGLDGLSRIFSLIKCDNGVCAKSGVLNLSEPNEKSFLQQKKLFFSEQLPYN